MGRSWVVHAYDQDSSQVRISPQSFLSSWYADRLHHPTLVVTEQLSPTVAVNTHIPTTCIQMSKHTRSHCIWCFKPNSVTSQPQISMCTARPPSLTLPALSPLSDESTEVIDTRAWTGTGNVEVQCSPRQSLKHKTLQHTHRLDTKWISSNLFGVRCYNNVWCVFQSCFSCLPSFHFTYRVNLLFYAFTVFLFKTWQYILMML